MYQPINNKNIKTYSLYDRESKVKSADFGKPFDVSKGFTDFLNSLPKILAAGDLVEIARFIAKAKKTEITIDYASPAIDLQNSKETLKAMEEFKGLLAQMYK